MASRREEKYILDYKLYSFIKNRVSKVLYPDIHYTDGSYIVGSMYFDDPYNTAFFEKTDGLSVHTKFRVRCYDYKDDYIRLEKKIKRGTTTIKDSSVITKKEFVQLTNAPFQTDSFNESSYPLASELQSKGLRPALIVRYRREAFFLRGTDVRVTFDSKLESLPADTISLFSSQSTGIPSINPLSIIMEIKYNEKKPVLIRKLCDCDAPMLSVSKYALGAQNIKNTVVSHYLV